MSYIKTTTLPKGIHSLPLAASDAVRAALTTKGLDSRDDLHLYKDPDIQNLGVNFNSKRAKRQIQQALDRISFGPEAALNMQVKAETNTVFNLEPAIIFAQTTRQLYPTAKLKLSIRLDDYKAELSNLEQEQLLEFFLHTRLEKLLRKADQSKTKPELENEVKAFQQALIELQNNGVALEIITQEASNSAHESYLAIAEDYKKNTEFTHFIEFVQDAPLQHRSNIGISTALKEMRREAKRVYPHIAVLNTMNHKSRRSRKELLAENLSEFYDTGYYVVKGESRKPGVGGGSSFLQRFKYRSSK